MTEAVLEVEGVKKAFGKNTVLEDISLSVGRGEIFALLGRNGAGKTTLIRVLLGLLPRDAGGVRVLGLDPAREALAIRERVGYLAEDQTMYGWMTAEEVTRFVGPFYPTWDDDLAQRYFRQFEIPARRRVRHLSNGQNVRLALVLALAHRPRLVILDDPALGLDPILRKEFNRDLVTHLQGEGVAVFYSSHLLYEVEPVADRVAIIERGRIVENAPTEALRERVKTITLAASAWTDRLRQLPALLDIRRDGSEVALTSAQAPKAVAELVKEGIRHGVVDLNLDEIFEAYVIGHTGADDPETSRSRADAVGRVA